MSIRCDGIGNSTSGNAEKGCGGRNGNATRTTEMSAVKIQSAKISTPAGTNSKIRNIF
jgi:hypothetical protein